MKKAKIILLALSLALLIGCAVGFSASAEETAPVIVSKNIKVDGNFSLMFAVDPATVAGDSVTLKIYASAPTADTPVVQTITKAKADTQKIDLDADGTAEYDAIVFETKGVSAKDIADNWYITTTSAGVTSDPIVYSVKEYAFERLYKNGTVFASETDENPYKYEQKQFYLEILDIGSAAQQLLVNYGAEVKEKLAKEYIYAAVVGGNYTLGEETATRGFVNLGDTLTLTSTDANVLAWDVYTFGKNGGLISTQTVASGDSFTVAGNVAATPYKMGVTAGKYFDEIGNPVYSMDGLDYLNFYGNKQNSQQVKPWYLGHTNCSQAGCGYITSTSGYGNVVGATKTEAAASQNLLHFPIAEAKEEGANCVVFEYDFLYTGMDLYYSGATTEGKIASNSVFYLAFNSNTLETATGKSWNGLTKTATFDMFTYDLDGVTTPVQQSDGSYQYKSESGTNSMRLPKSNMDLNANTWYNICIEVYAGEGIWVIYVDGNIVSYGTMSAKNISDLNSFSFMWDYRIRNYEMLIDDVCGAKIVKECPIK